MQPSTLCTCEESHNSVCQWVMSLSTTYIACGSLLALDEQAHTRRLRCNLDDEAAAALLPLTKMRSLDVRFCPLTNVGFKIVSRAMPDLERVPLEGCHVTTIGVWRLFCRYRGINLWPQGADSGQYSRFNWKRFSITAAAAQMQIFIAPVLHSRISSEGTRHLPALQQAQRGFLNIY